MRADGFATVRITNLPGWTWILLFFGIWPFLIAAYFATRRIDALIPMSDLALRRQRAFTSTYAIFVTLAVVLLAIGLVGEHPTVVWIGLLTALLTILFIAFGWLFVYPTGRFLDQDWISLSFVDERFATALDRWYLGSRVATGHGARSQRDGSSRGDVVKGIIIVVAVVAVLYLLSLAFCSQADSNAAARTGSSSEPPAAPSAAQV
jgi:hypothetical protein